MLTHFEVYKTTPGGNRMMRGLDQEREGGEKTNTLLSTYRGHGGGFNTRLFVVVFGFNYTYQIHTFVKYLLPEGVKRCIIGHGT